MSLEAKLLLTLLQESKYIVIEMYCISSVQNVTSGRPRCASWDFDLKRMHSLLTIDSCHIMQS